MDDELLEDFLIEAGEILEQLNEQLVELENSPDDSDLLNAVFRGFHTIKGGAGFLSIDAMVAICHRTEDVFNMLRNGEIKIDNHLMDTVLPVLDVLNAQFDALRSSETVPAAEQSLLSALEGIISGEAVAAADTAEAANPEPSPSTGSEDMSDDEFDTLLDALENPDAEIKNVKPKTASDEITDEEFEALLDDLHGKGKFDASAAKKDLPAAGSYEASKKDDEITEDEFEALLDNIHGKGKFDGSAAKSAAPATGSYEASKKDDEITEDEFEALLDDIHGKGKFSAGSEAKQPEKEKKEAAASKPEIVKET
ncbi:MAG: Hpt domain-containing protein, partial [Gammaproteobacteria bacterium]|nr:Hpt domain-containing protein [Gammaproteobacteria bacterium]